MISQPPSPQPEALPYTPQPRDRRNPNAWDALYLDEAIPVDPVAKAYMICDLQNWTRTFLLLPIRAIANLLLGIILVVKRALPFQFSHYKLMHRMAVWFLNHFVTPEACYLIVRHICLGSNIVNFLIDNGPDSDIEKSKLYPSTIEDLGENAFLEHDLILYNFVLDYSEARKKNPGWMEEIYDRKLNYDSIKPICVHIDVNHRKWLQVLDLESAIELFKIIYSFWLTRDEFERAVLSLEFDENFGCYVSAITGDYDWNHVITNRHPLAPESPFEAGRNLLLHGIITEYLHRYLELRQQACR
ncbi:MAG: hypothetical protein IGS48_00330 [Oscillatoriales cyanobacterium C42_A2020_001]|nr:hypothetical protein [Leptolyngbyaceae cyanobacterium C42_A2020_001]